MSEYAKAKTIKDAATMLGFEIERHGQAETGSQYIKLWHEAAGRRVVVRLADHEQVYSSAHFSCDDEGLTVLGVVDRLRDISQGNTEELDRISAALRESASENNKAYKQQLTRHLEAQGGERGAKAQMELIKSKLAKKAHEGGPKGDARRSMRATLRKLEECMKSQA